MKQNVPNLTYGELVEICKTLDTDTYAGNLVLRKVLEMSTTYEEFDAVLDLVDDFDPGLKLGTLTSMANMANTPDQILRAYRALLDYQVYAKEYPEYRPQELAIGYKLQLASIELEKRIGGRYVYSQDYLDYRQAMRELKPKCSTSL